MFRSSRSTCSAIWMNRAYRYNHRKDEDGEPLKDFDRFKLAMTQIVGKRLTWDRLTGKETVLPTCLNC